MYLYRITSRQWNILFLFPINWSKRLIVPTLLLFFWHNLSIRFLIKIVPTKQRMIFKIFYDHTYGSNVLVVLYFVMLIKKKSCAIWRCMNQQFTVQQCTIINYPNELKLCRKITQLENGLSWTKYREQTFLRYITWNLIVFSRLFNIYKVTEWMTLIEWSSVNETSNRQAKKVESWMLEKNPNRNSASPMFNKIVVLRNCAKHTEKDLYRSFFLLKLHAPSLQFY